MSQEPGAHRLEIVVQEGEEEGLGKSGEAEEFEAALPKAQAEAFKSQFGFGITDGNLDLPAAVVGQNNAPSILHGRDRFMSKEIPGHPSLAGAGNDEGERELRKVRDPDGDKEDPGFAFTASSGIIDQAMVQRAFSACTFPGLQMLSVQSDQFVVLLPADDKTDLVQDRQTQPGSPGKATIPNVDHGFSPAFGQIPQNLVFFLPFGGARLAAGRPEANVCERRSAFPPSHQHLQTVPSGHKDRSSGRWIEEARLDPFQSSSFARTNST